MHALCAMRRLVFEEVGFSSERIPWTGMSMVPLADIFNHKAAVVALAGNYQIEPNCFGDDDSSDSASGTEAASSAGEYSLACTQHRLSCVLASGLLKSLFMTSSCRTKVIAVCGMTGEAGEEADVDEASPHGGHGGNAAERAMLRRGMPVSRGSLLDGTIAAAHRLEIGICAVERDGGEEILRVWWTHLAAQPSLPIACIFQPQSVHAHRPSCHACCCSI